MVSTYRTLIALVIILQEIISIISTQLTCSHGQLVQNYKNIDLKYSPERVPMYSHGYGGASNAKCFPYGAHQVNANMAQTDNPLFMSSALFHYNTPIIICTKY